MLRDLDDRDRKQKSKRTGAWSSKVRTTSSAAYDSRVLIVAAMLIVLLLGGAVKMWSAKEDAEQLYGVPAGNLPNSTVVLPLELPRPVAYEEIKANRKKIVALLSDATQQSTSRKVSETVTSRAEISSPKANAFEPIVENAPPTAKKEATKERCCVEDDCKGSPEFKGNSDCQLLSSEKNSRQELKPSLTVAARVFEVKPSPLTVKQESQQFFRKGYDYFARNQLDPAVVNLETALRLDAENIQASLLLAQVYVASEQLTLAADILDKGLEKQEDNAQLAKQRAKLYLQQNDPEMAVQTLTRALGNAGTDSKFYAFLAALYQRQQKHEHTITLYHRALSVTPGVSKWWMGLAISLEASQRFQQSLQAYRRALRDKTLPPKVLAYIQQRIAVLAAYDYPVSANASEPG